MKSLIYFILYILMYVLVAQENKILFWAGVLITISVSLYLFVYLLREKESDWQPFLLVIIVFTLPVLGLAYSSYTDHQAKYAFEVYLKTHNCQLDDSEYEEYTYICPNYDQLTFGLFRAIYKL